MRIMKLAPLALLLIAGIGWPAAAQNWDSSGNSLLSGTYYFRHVLYVVGDDYGDLSEAVAMFGQISFSGAGTYTLSTNCEVLDAYVVAEGEAEGAVTCASWLSANSLTANGTYTISASGYGFLSNPLSSGDYIYGLVSQQGIFIGSTTETSNGFNDLFVAAPVSSQTSLATFKGSYWIADMDLSGNLADLFGEGQTGGAYTMDAMFQLNPNGAGSLGSFTVTGYEGGNGSTQISQNYGSYSYTESNSAYNLAIPTESSGLLSGQKFLYISPDGNFVFGGSPGAWDFFVGVRLGSGTPNFSGLYYQAGIDQPVDNNDIGYLDTYYGAMNDSSGSIIGHQRLDQAFAAAAIDYTYSDTFSPNSSGRYSDSYTSYAANSTARIGSGIGPYLGLHVALAAPTLSGSGVFLNPEGVVNAASSAPFTAAIVPGEFITLYGSGLAPSGLPAASVPFPTNIGGVQVMINSVAAPLYYATPGVIEAIVPYETTASIAQIQVINNGTASNTVTMYTGETAPGVFTQNPGGLGYGAIQHGADYSLVTPSNPAQAGETVLVYVSGLGTVSPAVADGAAASSTTLSQSTYASQIAVDFNGTTATVNFAGLVPGLAGLYQLNVVVPSGLTAGDNVLGIMGPDSYADEALIPVGAAATASMRGRLAGPFPALLDRGATTR
jgi:uncharacterized protein (TIGR03437 family)